ncbi:MAG TPA: hypothetical protein VKB34_11965 [Povalibacter sp.]|nr:hypothetical protein [Povalibacter sp.]
MFGFAAKVILALTVAALFLLAMSLALCNELVSDMVTRRAQRRMLRTRDRAAGSIRKAFAAARFELRNQGF